MDKTYDNPLFSEDDIVKVGEVYMPRSKAPVAESKAEPVVMAADLTDTTVKLLTFLGLQKKEYDNLQVELDGMAGGGKKAKKASAKKTPAKKPATNAKKPVVKKK